MLLRRSLPSLGLLLAVATLAAPGQAHIDLRSPPPRKGGAPDSTLRQRPCGQRANARVPEKVSTFEPGQSIDVEWDVYVQHFSYFRVAFDADGDDSFSERASLPSDPASDDPTTQAPGPGEQILAYVEDPTGSIDHVVQHVTLPDVECERCTLQLIQFTYNLPLDEATYYQCADLVLRRSGAPGSQAGSSGAGSDDTQGEPGEDAGAPTAQVAPVASEESGGCSLPGGSSSAGLRGGGRGGGLELGNAALGNAALGATLMALARRRTRRTGSWLSARGSGSTRGAARRNADRRDF